LIEQVLSESFLQLAVALGLGLLVGLQRERTAREVAGIRTFALITVFGTLSAQLASALGGWVVAAGFVATAGLLAAANLVWARTHEKNGREAEPGQTTEFAALVMFAAGALVVLGPISVPVVLGGAVAVLLHLKESLHGMAGRIGERDFRAIMQFVLISLVILPVLPDRELGPYGVLNPFEVWLMVVLIVGLSLAGYVAYKLLGRDAGTALAGALGGLISSTATTASYARRSRGGEQERGAFLPALVVMIASTVVYARVLVEVAAVAAFRFRDLAPPLAAMLGWAALVAAAGWWFGRGDASELPEQENPAELKGALLFGLLYAAVLLAVAWARDRFGTAGLYAVAVISGLTDVDAITLSTSRLVAGGAVEAATGWRAILLASLSNLAFKAGIVAALGTRRMLAWIGLLFGATVLGGAAILAFWP
jgi:uncharacterized membrane protein (DUF4010 family)